MSRIETKTHGMYQPRGVLFQTKQWHKLTGKLVCGLCLARKLSFTSTVDRMGEIVEIREPMSSGRCMKQHRWGWLLCDVDRKNRIINEITLKIWFRHFRGAYTYSDQDLGRYLGQQSNVISWSSTADEFNRHMSNDIECAYRNPMKLFSGDCLEPMNSTRTESQDEYLSYRRRRLEEEISVSSFINRISREQANEHLWEEMMTCCLSHLCVWFPFRENMKGSHR
jgi:hypothetical protein